MRSDGQMTGFHTNRERAPKVCDLKATDSGKVCSDSSECQGSCVTPDSIASDSKASGTCSAYVSDFGNVKLVEHGKVVLLNVE